jgi:nanoRNase/pAp phosphatase (c-di-AMP/oligoRNAs hydrolase)
MRNPWREFPSVPLGDIFSRFGGGGHQRVGALILPTERIADARAILDQILFELRTEEGKSHDSESQFL